MPDVSLVGYTRAENVAFGTTLSVARTVTPGNLIVVLSSNEGGPPSTVTNVTDGTTTITNADVSLDVSSVPRRLAAHSFPNHAGGAKTFGVTWDGSVNHRSMVVLELTNAHLTTPLDAASTGTGNSAAPASANVTPSVNGCYILGYATGASALTFAGGAWTDIFNDAANDTGNWIDLEGLAQAVAGTTAPTWTMASSVWGAVALVYKPAAGGGGGGNPTVRRFAINQRIG